MTGGENIKGNPLEIIRDENEALQNRVVIHTFGVGIGESFIADLISILKCNKLGTAEKELLRDIAQQTMNNNSYGYVKSGKSVFLPDLSSLNEAMGTYYDYFSVPIATAPTYTRPYKDFFTNEEREMKIKVSSERKLELCARIFCSVNWLQIFYT